MIDSLKDLKDIYEFVRTAIDRCKEPKSELLQISEFLKVLTLDETIIKEKVDKDYKRYFQEDFTHGLLKRLIREKSNDEKYLEIIADIFESYLQLFITALKQGPPFSQHFIDSMKTLFEYDNLLHSYNYQISDSQLKLIKLKGQTWRTELKEGDMVDALQDENMRCSAWSQAKITSIAGDVLQLQFLVDAKFTDKLIDRNSLDLAPFESKTKSSFAWKSTVKVGDILDAYDKNTWNKATVFDIQEKEESDRKYQVLFIAFRIYNEKGNRNDARGNYDGYSEKFDEWIPLYSPRIQPFFTKTSRSFYDDFLDIDDDLDALYPNEEGHSRVYAVPRIRKCTSKLFIHLMNQLGNMNGFQLIVDTITQMSENCATAEELGIIFSLIEMASKPYQIYHKEFQQEFFPNVLELAKKCIRNAPDKTMRDLQREKLDGVTRSIDNMLKRMYSKEDREKETEILKLELCLLQLKSGYLERRIQGIKELNQLIKSNRAYNSKSLPNKVLIKWLEDNEVFPLLFDPKKTHMQIVQRLGDILRLLLLEDSMSPSLFEMFWNLSKSDYKLEVYKILNDVAFNLKKEHFDYVLSQITGNAGGAEKMSIDDYMVLHEMSKNSKDEDFKVNVNKFFWDIIIKSDQQKMGQLIVQCLNFMRTNRIQVYKRFYPSSNEPAAAAQASNIQDGDSSQISTDSNPQQSNNNNEDQSQKNLEMMEREVIDAIIRNLGQYCQQVRDLVSKQEGLATKEGRKKLYLTNQKYSHHDEIDERLQFIKYVANFSQNLKITKAELGTIYELLVTNSKISSDQEEFLIWCKSLCESSSIYKSILDLNEVGEFFTEKMKSKELDIKSLPMVGFEFLQHYFLSVNEKACNLIKSSAKNQKQSKFVSNSNFNNMGGPYQQMNTLGQKKIQEEEDKVPIFKLLTVPKQLEQLDIVWNVALECENPKVVPHAINFLIKIHYNLDDSFNERKCDIQDELIEKCMGILSQTNNEFTMNRVIEIIKHIIYEAEKKGTGDVQPHNAVLKGELLERITIRYKTSAKKNSIQLSIYSNTTVWEFKKEVSKQLDLAPKYLKLERGNGQVLKDLDNGKTLAETGIQGGETMWASKIFVEEEIADAPLIGANNKLTEKAIQIFTEWFGLYSEDGAMTKETCGLFIKGCTGEHPHVTDDRIGGLFQQYDINKDGKIELKEFLQFYENSARAKPSTVRENLKAHNIRNDLKKLSEVQEESSFKKEDMPRFKISENQTYFDKLMELLDRSDSVSQTSWDLIQMLATNRIIYKRVLQLKTATNENNKIDWAKFFDSQSDYKLLYTLQIVEAVMEEGEGQNLERIVVIQEQDVQVSKTAPVAPPLAGADLTPGIVEEEKKELPKEEEPHQLQLMKKNTGIVEDEEDQLLKSEWTSMFLKNDGIQYILKVFMAKEIQVGQSKDKFSSIFELKHIAFLLKLLRIFIMAAFSTSKESQVYQEANLVRRYSSSFVEEGEKENMKVAQSQSSQNRQTEGQRFKELQTLLAGPMGEEIIQQLDYKLLQQKILRVISQILCKEEMIFEDKLIIENALSLWVGCVLHRNELFNEFYSFKGAQGEKIKDCDSLILHGLLFCPYEKVRDEFRQSLSSISFKLAGNGLKAKANLIVDPLMYLLKLLSGSITEISKYQSKQYFELFCSIIEYFFMMRSLGYTDSKDETFNPEQLLSHVIDKIKEYNQLAMDASEHEENDDGNQDGNSGGQSEIETVYVGLIQLTSKIIDNFDIKMTADIVQQKSLIEEIFVKFLFASVFKDGSQKKKEIRIQPKKQRKTQKTQVFGKKSKDAAYKLIHSLIRRSPLLMNNFLENSMIPLMKVIRRLDVWNYSPTGNQNNSDKSQQQYVGLRNLGAICYMNSMLQQFFMIPAFRYNLLCVDDQLPEDLKEYKGNKIDDNVLHQFQKLIAHLELSERSEYNPYEFCYAFKEMNGNPTNTGEQKDAQEFLNLIFDRIENMLKATSRKYLLQSVFGGQTCSQLVCSECGKVRNKIEDFYNLSLTVKDIKSMHDSLQKMIEGEVINDYQCEGCGKKVDVSKRTLISQTPNVLIVHLQRIVFNFDTFKNDKLNTFFEFPHQLDLKPYSFYEVMRKENRLQEEGKGEEEDDSTITTKQPDPISQSAKKEGEQIAEEDQWPEEEDCYEYKLVGTTVHSGTADAGHYWSYINTKRGYLEPDGNDPTWNTTEGDPWMEFNDSRVTEFNFEKLRDECCGDQSKSGGSNNNDSGWSSWGGYGKSAYMLVYERKKKRPIKVIASGEEVEKAKEKDSIKTSSQNCASSDIIYDQVKEEYYKLIDYREGVEDIAPNKIYKQVNEDNKKFEFDNDIYSQEFFDFIKQILQAVQTLSSDKSLSSHENASQLMEKVYENAIFVGKKSILEILSKCFYNQTIKNLVEILIEIMKANEDLCFKFMNQCYVEDNFEYLMMILLECPDAVARLNVCNLIKFILNKLKIREQGYLYETVRQEIEFTDSEGQQQVRVEENPRAMTTKFILKCLDNLNTQVAKNWSRFDQFLELILCFGVGDAELQKQFETEEEKVAFERIGLEFLFRQKFIGKACDFLLGKKSPLATPNEKRFEMGGSYSNPNFSSILKLLTRMINDTELIEKYPLTELEKKLLLQYDLLKVMLGQAAGSKQFGICLSNLCKNNIKASKKVAKIFIKIINGSTYDNVKHFLKALKPFLTLNDGFKGLRLEWVFGFPQIITRKEYRDSKFKFGIDVIQKINDDTYTYSSPLTNGPSEEALLAQLLKCKGRVETFAINCLKEMLSLMVKDDDIARFIYYMPPHNYQYARYIDWIKSYLEGQKSDLERNSSYTYMKQKYDTVIKALALFSKFEEKMAVFLIEEKERYDKDLEEGVNYKGFEEDFWGFQNEDVIKHYPPQLVIGKQVADERVLILIDDHPLVDVTIIELTTEYNYSNPTTFFNISLPHVDLRTSMYQTMSYHFFKKSMIMNEINQKKAQKAQEAKEKAKLEEEKKQEETPQTQEGEIVEEPINPQEETKEESKEETKGEPEQEEIVIKVRDWYENKKEGPVLLKVHVANKHSDTIKFKITLKSGENKNELLPKSFMSDTLYQSEYKCIGYYQKLDPTKPWSQITVDIDAHLKGYGKKNLQNVAGSTNSDFKINVFDQSGTISISDSGQIQVNPPKTISCMSCREEQSMSNFKCVKCGQFITQGQTYDPQSTSIYENYYT